MVTSCWVWTVLLLGLWLTDSTQGLPIYTFIDCETPQSRATPVVEEYEGVVEFVNISRGAEIFLESPSCAVCVSFLELNYTVGDTSASVITKKPLDVDVFKDPNTPTDALPFVYDITCSKNGVKNNRNVGLFDINDNAPVFEKDKYTVNVSETKPVSTLVIQVEAVDADISAEYSHILYSIEPPTTTFEILSDGSIILKEQLNYTVSKLYNLTVKGKNIDLAKVGQTAVVVHVLKPPGLHFEHDLYNAMIPENEVGPFLSILPAPIRAYYLDQEIVYNITEVSPGEFWGNFTIEKETGVINVEKELDREKTSTINLVVMASLKNDSMKTAKTMVVVTVADVNEPPVIHAVAYSRVISNEMPPGYPVVKIEATDPDVGEIPKYSLEEPSSTFAVEPSSGQVYVVSVAGESGKVSLQVKVEDKHGLYDTTMVEVTIENIIISVTISLNQPHDGVMDKVMEMKDALQKALGLDVEIISVTEGSDGGSLVRLIAMETSGNTLPAEDLKKELVNKKEMIQTELVVVFGPDVDFNIFEKDSDTTMTIILATVIPVIGIALIIAAVWAIRRQRRQ